MRSIETPSRSYRLHSYLDHDPILLQQVSSITPLDVPYAVASVHERRSIYEAVPCTSSTGYRAHCVPVLLRLTSYLKCGTEMQWALYTTGLEHSDPIPKFEQSFPRSSVPKEVADIGRIDSEGI